MLIYISTCDRYDHLVPGCCALLNKHWPGQQIEVLGFRPIAKLPANVAMRIMANGETKPWSTHLGDFLRAQNENHFVFMFDDYFMRAQVDQQRIDRMYEYIKAGTDKCDLTGNTMYFEHYDWPSNPDIVVAAQTAQYRASTQMAIWNKSYFLKLLKPNWNPWEFELQAETGKDGATILGPRTPICQYANIMYKGAFAPYMWDTLSMEDRELLKTVGYTPPQ